MRFKAETLGAETDCRTRQATDQRLDEVLADLCIPGAAWRLSSGQPAVPVQLRRTELLPLARGWQEFIIHSLVPTGNKSEITVARAILIHSIIRGEEQSFYENMQKSQAEYMEEVKQIKAKQEEMWNNTNRFQSQIRKEQEMLAREIQELNLWTKNTSVREAYTCWAHQQASPNLSEIPITQIPDLMQTNVEKGRPMFFGCLKSDYAASSSSQTDQQEPVPLRTAPPPPGYQPPRPLPN
ncbi:hypothetical protein PIB30_059365 [Stylosanthes scabra]|uniref:Putative plant transposon protein domain-containing protein n=1 Tax=Stylosanthes scabra TaxID=79078 RepID=A0ABU6YHM9_9FABA|nr:hypothetical protein [Stylosanthes scabra]